MDIQGYDGFSTSAIEIERNTQKHVETQTAPRSDTQTAPRSDTQTAARSGIQTESGSGSEGIERGWRGTLGNMQKFIQAGLARTQRRLSD